MIIFQKPYEIKTLNFKEYKQQLKLARPCTKKMFEIARAFNDFKFQPNLKLEFTKDEKGLNEIKFVNPWLDSYKEVFDDAPIDEQVDKQYNNHSAATANWTHKGSSWSIQSIYSINLLFRKLML